MRRGKRNRDIDVYPDSESDIDSSITIDPAIHVAQDSS